MNHLRGLIIVFFVLCLVQATTSLLAAVPIVMSHQGRLLDSSDHPLNGTFALTYSIYEAPTGGAPLWTEDHVGVSVVDGLFSVELGSTTPLSPDVLSGSSGGATVTRYLQIQVSGQPPISPRTQLLASPYAVASSRVSGDVETAPGGITATNVQDALVVSVNASDPESQLSASKSGHKRFGIGIGQPDNPLGTRMALGDLNRDGLLDVVATDGASSMTLVDSTSSGGAVVSSSVSSGLGLQPMGGNILIHAGNATRSSRSSIECAPDSVVSTQSTSTNGLIKNMRTRINELEARLTLETDLDGDGIADLATDKYVDNTSAGVGVSARGTGSQSSNANLAAVLNGNTVIGCRRYTDGSGIPDNSCTMTSNDLGASCKTSGSKGFYYVVTNAGSGIAADATTQVAADANNNGHAERSVWQKVDNSTALSSTTVDFDDDGVPDVGTENSATVSRNILKSYFERGDKPTSSQFRTMTDSAGAYANVEVDLNHDGNPDGGSSMDAKETRSTLKTYFETGEVPTQDNVVQSSCDSGGAAVSLRRPTALLTWGTGLAFRVDGSGQSITMDQDSLPTFSAMSTSTSTDVRLSKATADGDTKLSLSAGSSDCSIKLGDINRDGFAELSTSSGSNPTIPQTASLRLGRPTVNTALFSADGESAALSLDHQATSPGDKPTSLQFGTLIDSYIHMSEDGLTRCALESSSGLQLRDRFNNLTTSMTTEGTGYFADKVGIGVDVPSHRIDVAGGAYCDGTNWVNASDRNSKENFAPVNGEELLNKISQLEITKWNYKGDSETEHIGPTAQDFRETFGVGSDGKSISTIDPSGIALAAIKELNKQNRELQQQSRELVNQNRDLKEQNSKLKKQMDDLAQKVEKLASGK
jgi:hypothetical protein